MNLANFIKYCLGYIKLTRARTFVAQQRYSVGLNKEYFNLIGLLNGEADGSLNELINFNIFYSFDPKNIAKESPEIQANYEKEKALADKIEEIYSKYKNDPFTKQIVLNFGYFEIELPIVEEDGGMDFESDEEISHAKMKIDRYPLFSLPVKIEKILGKGGNKYHVFSVDSEVQVNVGVLEEVLGEDLYYQLVEKIGAYEMEGSLTLPITDERIFIEVWHAIKGQLKHTKAQYDENSFLLHEMQIALRPRANYFLAEDLQKLAKLGEEELKGTALTSWVEDENLNFESSIPEDKDLYFPFSYDKYQLRVLSVINNTAAIVQGPPGTGKSETIANILCHLAACGKKVLFVSQKTQALKVVKDKLKKLDVKYLFGYIPNPASLQLGEEDEIDGIAPQLSAISAHLENLGYKSHSKNRSSSILGSEMVVSPTLASSAEEKNRLKNSLSAVIETQRRYFELSQELQQLERENFSISVANITRFEESFSHQKWNQIKALKAHLSKVSKLIKDYRLSGEKGKFDQIFSSLNLNGRRYSSLVSEIHKDILKSGYDRRSKLMRKLNNIVRNLRISAVRSQLPREIIDHIDGHLNSDISRNEAVRKIESLHNYCYFHENMYEFQTSQESLRTELECCGLSDEQYEIIIIAASNARINDMNLLKEKILRVYEIQKELQSLKQGKDPNKLSSALKKAEHTRAEEVALYIQNIINQKIISKWAHGATVRRVIAKLARAFGKSKKAFKTFDNLRKEPENFDAILDLIPIWIMELDDASRIVPLENGIFDYVILDEASQCNVAYTLPVMFRSKHALFVGDSEQMRDSTIMFKSNKSFDELASRYKIPDELQIKSTGSAVQSVLDIATLRGFKPIPLRYHYRSPAELIGFSNKYFYTPKGKELISLNNKYLTYKDTNRIMTVYQVSSDWNEEISDKVNVAEAKEILKLFKVLRNDAKYQDKSIGILTFFNAQATYIRELFEREKYHEEENNYKVSIIEGIQGDEKDILIYSFVIRSLNQKNKYVPLTGEGGDIRADINRGRVNVAFSRAKLQVHCFISMPVEQIPEGIWIKKYLEYVQKNGEVDFYSTDLKPFDSFFEEEFYNLVCRKLAKSGYKTQNQVRSCGFKIDFVVTNSKNAKSLAIECDGPTHFKDEIDETYGIYVESDQEREGVLRAAGWDFYRIKYSDWIDKSFDRSATAKNIIKLLD